MQYLVVIIILIIILIYLSREEHTIAESKQDKMHILKTSGDMFTYDKPDIGEMDLENKYYGVDRGFQTESNAAKSDMIYDSDLRIEDMRSIPVEQDADEKLVQRRISGGKHFKRALEGRARTTRNTYEKYFRNELDNFEEQEWWGGETNEAETDWRRTF